MDDGEGCGRHFVKADGTPLIDEDQKACRMRVAAGEFGYAKDSLSKRYFLDRCLAESGFKEINKRTTANMGAPFSLTPFLSLLSYFKMWIITRPPA